MYIRKQSLPNLRYYPVVCQEGLRKTTRNLNQGSRTLGEISTQDLPNMKQEANHSVG